MGTLSGSLRSIKSGLHRDERLIGRDRSTTTPLHRSKTPTQAQETDDSTINVERGQPLPPLLSQPHTPVSHRSTHSQPSNPFRSQQQITDPNLTQNPLLAPADFQLQLSEEDSNRLYAAPQPLQYRHDDAGMTVPDKDTFFDYHDPTDFEYIGRTTRQRRTRGSRRERETRRRKYSH